MDTITHTRWDDIRASGLIMSAVLHLMNAAQKRQHSTWPSQWQKPESDLKIKLASILARSPDWTKLDQKEVEKAMYEVLDLDGDRFRVTFDRGIIWIHIYKESKFPVLHWFWKWLNIGKVRMLVPDMWPELS